MDYIAAASAIPKAAWLDEYVLNLERADELFKVLVTECSMSQPRFVRDVLIGAESIQDYERDNLHVIREPA